MARKYAIIGTGALGGFYGAKLAKSGQDVHFLLHSDYDFVRENGLKIDSVNGDFSLPNVNAYNNPQNMPKCDVIIVSLKTTNNHLLPDILPHLISNDSLILLLENGFNIEFEIAKIVGDNRIMGGVCSLCSNKIAPGYIKHLDYGAITLGDYAPNYQICGVTNRMQNVANDFINAGITINLAEDLLLARWKKLVWNIPYNGLSVVLNSTTDQLMDNPFSRQLVIELMQEVQLGASGNNRVIPDDYITEMLDYTDKMTPYSPSMKLDYEAKRPLEVEAILGHPLKEAEKNKIQLPKIKMLYQQLKFINMFM